MNQTELRRYEKLLRAKEAELARGLNQREDIHIEAAPDLFDEVQRSIERDLVIHHLDRDSMVLRQVRAALARLDQGSFGSCLSCEEDISTRRLNAVPWAALCLGCQEKFDRENSGTPFEFQPAGAAM